MVCYRSQKPRLTPCVRSSTPPLRLPPLSSPDRLSYSGSPGGTTTITLSSTLKVCITPPPHNVTLSGLQRLKRQFVTLHTKAITLGTTERGGGAW
ncbi:hypothetical protein EDD17DRAFT_1575435 [Pisolithus thermaeus]|nr:hypothetical protein EV401DRAFT_318467 [Pisolithus croceorrhizus]KAI6162487.1 hypothetical protein EDD17DRAFT_1575435 [Pisolithus thermaeus]